MTGPEESPRTELPGDDPSKGTFTPKVLDKTVIAIPLLERLRKEQVREQEEGEAYQPPVLGVVLDLNLEYVKGRQAGRDRAGQLIDRAIQESGRTPDQGVNADKSELSNQYLFAKLEPEVIRQLVRLDGTSGEDQETSKPGPPAATGPAHTERVAASATQRSVYRIWPDFPIGKLTTKSVSTVKADAARVAFSALGQDIVWAVVDSGIDGTHPHFVRHGNVTLDEPLKHRDFTDPAGDPLTDEFGHGTHVAGIIAGALSKDPAAGTGSAPTPDAPPEIRAVSRHRDESGEVTYEVVSLDAISGMAPRCRLVSLKVLDANGQGEVSSLIAAIEHIQRVNDYGRRLRIHGVNLSVGYEFEPEWFACGQSPLCVEVDLLVRTGVVVVVAAGNTGYGYNQDAFKGTAVPAGLDLTINDPGNADLAITVGSTHREMPHVYGVSYFSSKGPTGDGRMKPDLVAPGEKILSCAAGQALADAKASAGDCQYVEDSGTSMAAPHVSGVIAAFLSVRREFIGRPEAVKDIFLSSATDLKRAPTFQGHGLVDLMRAIQSV
ncbi:MAG: serine protease AprX [Blastococcus sp.]|nr:serine protease AprX [Blastococcus sp.]